MDLKYDDLTTFLEVYQAGTFTRAAVVLGLSQSALSQKIARIEESLQATIFIRHPRSLSLTASGEKLLIYAKEASQMQEDFLSIFNQYQNELSGVIRIAGFSSVMRSVIIPKVSTFLRKNPLVSIEFQTFEMSELEGVLKSNRSDFIITDYFPNISQTEEMKIFEEEYVLINSKKYKSVIDTYLDHGPSDNATDSYFKHLGLEFNYKRKFMGDVYSIIDGVALGLGSAVMSKHLIESDKRFEIVMKKKRYIRPVVLTHLRQSYYSPVHNKVYDLLTK